MTTSKKLAHQPERAVHAGTSHLYSLTVSLRRGTPAEAVVGPPVSRTLQLRGDQSLDLLHQTIDEAFGRGGEISYEFQFDAGARHPEGQRYVLPGAYEISVETGIPAAGRVTETRLDALHLTPGLVFTYWPDGVDDCWYQITVERVREGVPRGRYPRVTKRDGDSSLPATANATSSRIIGREEGAETACLVGEVHLDRREYHKAVEAFSRAIETEATVDAFEGRARAYRALADEDERSAQRLRPV